MSQVTGPSSPIQRNPKLIHWQFTGITITGESKITKDQSDIPASKRQLKKFSGSITIAQYTVIWSTGHGNNCLTDIQVKILANTSYIHERQLKFTGHCIDMPTDEPVNRFVIYK